MEVGRGGKLFLTSLVWCFHGLSRSISWFLSPHCYPCGESCPAIVLRAWGCARYPSLLLFVHSFLLVVVFSVVLGVTRAVLSVFLGCRFKGVPRGICCSAPLGLLSASRSCRHGGSWVKGADYHHWFSWRRWCCGGCCVGWSWRVAYFRGCCG